jgi:hypothetical protein
MREHVLTCHACGELESAERGSAERGSFGRLCAGCRARVLRMLRRWFAP